MKRLSVFFSFFPYAGNSTGSSMVFDVTAWFAELAVRLRTEDKFQRVSERWFRPFCDTPITMTRNAAVREAQQVGADILVMVDSDMRPDVRVGQDPSAVRFFDAAFDAIYDHWSKGPLVIGAPYGGTPPHENMFVFQWTGRMNAGEEQQFSLEQYTREEAFRMRGIKECAALPTGLIMYDMRAFELVDPPYFRYEWTDKFATQKASTEDVVNTRDISLAGIAQLGYNPVRCAWDSWAGHLKVWCVDKPDLLTAEAVAETLKRAYDRGRINEERVELKLPKWAEGREVHRVEDQPDHKTAERHVQALLELLKHENVRLHRQLSVLEVGTWTGETAARIIDLDEVKGLCCVDNFRGSPGDWTSDLAERRDIESEWERRMAPWRSHVVLHRGESVDVASSVRRMGREFDVVFIDGDHSYEQTKADIEAWWPCVADDGIMIGHDYMTKQFPGVDKAVEEFFGDHAQPYAVRKDAGGFWLVKKYELAGAVEGTSSSRAG